MSKFTILAHAITVNRKYYPFILSLVAAFTKVLLVEIGFALNFLSITYHGILSKDDIGLEILGVLITFGITFSFYLAYSYALVLLKFKTQQTTIYLLIGLIMASVEFSTFNLPEPLINDLSSIVTLMASDIFISYLINYSIAYRAKLGC